MAGAERKIYELEIVRIATIGPDTRAFFLRRPPELDFIPGQFLSFLLPIGDSPVTKPYSIASDPEERGTLEVVLNLVPGGIGSSYIFSLERGATLSATGPWGTFTLSEPPKAECIFLAESTGIAAIRPMLRRALRAGRASPVRLHHAVEDSAGLLYREEWEDAMRRYTHFESVPWIGLSMEKQVESLYIDGDSDRSRHFFICGVGNIVTRLRDRLRQAGYERRAVQYEKW